MIAKYLRYLILLVTFLVSCKTAQDIDDIVGRPGETQLVTETLVAIGKPTQVERETATPTQQQQEAVPTRIPLFEMELTQLPTLSPEVRDELFFDLMENNGGCDLPCWWSIVPGVSTWPQAAKLYSNFTDGIQTHDVSIPVERQGEKYRITLQMILFELPEGLDFELGAVEFRVRETGVIEGIRPSTGGSGTKYSLINILTKMKTPSELLVNITEIDLGFDHYYTVNIYLRYTEIGVFANFGDTVTIDTSPLEPVCFSGPAIMYLWNPVDNFQLDDLLNESVANNLIDTQSAFGLSAKEFIRSIVEDGQECFSIEVNE